MSTWTVKVGSKYQEVSVPSDIGRCVGAPSISETLTWMEAHLDAKFTGWTRKGLYTPVPRFAKGKDTGGQP